MAEHRTKKPTLFISHATSDAEFANAVKQEIEKVFANGVSVFSTSSPGTIPVGQDWLSDVEEKLGVPQAVVPARHIGRYCPSTQWVSNRTALRLGS